VEGLLASDAPDWRTRQQSGSGVHHSKQVVEAHGGRLGIHPARGRGTTFYFTLPEG